MFPEECPICYNLNLTLIPFLVCCKNGKLCCDNCVKKIHTISNHCPYCFKSLNVSQNYYKELSYKLLNFIEIIIICLITYIYLKIYLYFETCSIEEIKLNKLKLCLEKHSLDYILERNDHSQFFDLNICEWV